MKYTKIILPINNNDIKSNKHKMKYIIDQFEKINETLKKIDKNEINSIKTVDEFLDYLKLTEKEYIEIIRRNIKRPQIFLKRNINEIYIYINQYNKLLLQLMKCDVDFQYILDVYACTCYIVDQIEKSPRGLSKAIKETADQADKNNHHKEKLRAIINCYTNKSEVSAQEVAYHLLGQPLSISSRQTVFINTSPVNERCKILKSKAELEKIFKKNPNSTDIYKNNDIDQYSKRPAELENLCLADFIAMYQFNKSISGHHNLENDDYEENNNENDDNSENENDKTTSK